MPDEVIMLGRHPVGPGHEPLFLPDIGTFFNQDLGLARELAHQVKEAGTRVIKGEILHDINICLATDVQERYLSAQGELVSEPYHDVIARKIVSLDDYARLFELCRDLDMAVVLSVYDIEGANFARAIGACAIKIASTNIVHAPLIRHVAGLGLPMLIDTGKAGMEEIERAVRWAEEAGAGGIIVEHSPAAPPAPLAEHHLRMLQGLRERFGHPVGLSDHHAGEEMLYAATALGACVLEKGVCPTGLIAEQDAYHALPVDRLAAVMARCRDIHQALGQTQRQLPGNRERPAARMGLVARRPLGPGDAIGLDTVRFAFPTLGIPVEDWDQVINRRLASAVDEGHPIDWAHLQPPA